MTSFHQLASTAILVLGCAFVIGGCARRLTPAERQARASNAAAYEYAAVRQGAGSDCYFRRQGDYSKVARFRCGEILLEVRPMSDAKLQQLLQSLRAELERDNREHGWILIRVATGQELVVIRRALRDDRVLSANLNWNEVEIRQSTALAGPAVDPAPKQGKGGRMVPNGRSQG